MESKHQFFNLKREQVVDDIDFDALSDRGDGGVRGCGRDYVMDREENYFAGKKVLSPVILNDEDNSEDKLLSANFNSDSDYNS